MMELAGITQLDAEQIISGVGEKYRGIVESASAGDSEINQKPYSEIQVSY